VREFVVVGHDAPTSAEFSLDDLPGAGRLDVLCRCLTAGLLRSHGVREDTRVQLVLADEFTVGVDGGAVRRLNPDERSTAAVVRGALERRDEAVGAMPVETHPGVELRRRGLADTLDAVAERAGLVALCEDGTPATESAPFDRDDPPDVGFVLSDHREFTREERDLLDEVADRRLRLGPEPLHADQAIVVAHHLLDTRGYEQV